MSPPTLASRPSASRLRGAGSGAMMAVGSMSCVQLGLALSAHLLDQLGPLGIAGLRLAWAGVLLLILVRPRPRDFTVGDRAVGAALLPETAQGRRSRQAPTFGPARPTHVAV
jgi:inner membrane transporter RhtA